jgi:predicted dehydrogenase
MSKHKRTISRRQFVQGTAAAALTLPVLRTALATAADKSATTPSERITLGFIGTGFQCRFHIGHFLGMNDVQLLAVCDVDNKRRDHAKEMVEKHYADKKKNGQYKGCAAYNDFREVLARKDIDAVVIATPDHWHAIPAIEACKAGMDVYCEKPLSLTIHEAKLMRDAARKYARVFQTGSQQRSDNEFRLACELVRSGRIGKLKSVYVNVGGPSHPCDLPAESDESGLDWERWLGPAPKRPYNSVLSPRGVHNHFPNWRSYREYSGGMMTDWGAHHFDIAQWALGMDESGPVEISPPEEAKAEKGVRYIYASGVVVHHADKDDAGKEVNGITFAGSDGKIFVNRGYLKSDPPDIIKQPLGAHDVRLIKSSGHQRDWIECVRSRRRPICDVEIGARSVTVCHLGNLAYWNHRKLRWDPEHWQFVEGAEANRWLDREHRDPWKLPTL